MSSTPMASTMATTHMPETEHMEGEEGEAHPQEVILFIFLALFCGSVLRAGARFLPIKLPYTVLLLLLGLAWGEIRTSNDLGSAAADVSNINPELFTHIFFPLLIFESAFSLHWHVFKRSLAQMLILAVIGVLIATALTSVVVRYVIEPSWGWANALTLGAILSATDPVAVVAILKEVGASAKLRVLLEGESLLNDGTAIVLFSVFLDIARGENLTAGDITQIYLQLSLGGLFFGFAWGVATIALLGVIHNELFAETTITVSSAFLLFYVSEKIEVSGVLAIVVMGVLFVWFGKTRITPHVLHTLEHFWEILAFQGETVLFVLAGDVMSRRVGLDAITGAKLGNLLALYVFLTLIRGFMIGALSPCLYRLGYKFGPRRATVLIHGGLRGAVSLALALIVDLHDEIDEQIRQDTLLYASGITLLTLLINATTTSSLVNSLGLTRETEAEKQHFQLNFKDFRKQVEKDCDDLRVHTKYTGINWGQVRDFVMPNLDDKRNNKTAPSNTVELQPTTSSAAIINGDAATAAASDVALDMSLGDLEDIRESRLRFLQGFRQKCHQMLRHGNIARRTHDALFDAAEAADDHACSPLCLWPRYISGYVATPKWISAMSRVDNKLFNDAHSMVALQHVQRAINITDGFLEGYQHMFHHVSGASRLEQELRKEIVHEIKQAEDFLARIFLKYPKQLATARSHFAAAALLNDSERTVHEFELRGLFTSKEVERIRDHIDKQERKIVLYGHAFSEPSVDELLWGSPMFWHCPFDVFESILVAKQTQTFKTGHAILDAGVSVPGIAFLLQGSCKTMGHKGQAVKLQPGSVIGLYEALNDTGPAHAVTAVTACTVAVLPFATLRDMIAQPQYGQLRRNVLKIAAHYLSLVDPDAEQHRVVLDELMTKADVVTVGPSSTVAISSVGLIVTGSVAGEKRILPAGTYETYSAGTTEIVTLDKNLLITSSLMEMPATLDVEKKPEFTSEA